MLESSTFIITLAVTVSSLPWESRGRSIIWRRRPCLAVISAELLYLICSNKMLSSNRTKLHWFYPSTISNGLRIRINHNKRGKSIARLRNRIMVFRMCLIHRIMSIIVNIPCRFQSGWVFRKTIELIGFSPEIVMTPFSLGTTSN